MAKLKVETFSDALALAKARGGAAIIGHNRWVQITPAGRVQFGLHGTALVEVNPADRTFRVQRGRWASVTTRAAFNDFLAMIRPGAVAFDKGRTVRVDGEEHEVPREFVDSPVFSC